MAATRDALDVDSIAAAAEAAAAAVKDGCEEAIEGIGEALNEVDWEGVANEAGAAAVEASGV